MLKGLIFDINGTVTDIYTSESDDDIYRMTANFLDYYQIRIAPEILREEYFSILRRQKKESLEEFPEFDVIALFAEIMQKYGTKKYKNPSAETLALLFRAASRYKLELYDGVLPTLNKLSKNYLISAVSDGQKIWAEAELHSVGLDRFFRHVIVSSSYGFRKPDPRMFHMALEQMNLQAHEVIFVGNDMYRDIAGAHDAGLKTVFFRSNQGEQNFAGAEPDYIIYNFSQLLEAVAFLERQMN